MVWLDTTKTDIITLKFSGTFMYVYTIYGISEVTLFQVLLRGF